MKKMLVLGLLIVTLITACGVPAAIEKPEAESNRDITVYKTPN